MIKGILRAIRDLGVVNTREIAEKIGIEESTLEHVITLLASKGYVKCTTSSQNVPITCIGCPVANQCNPQKNEGIYVVTEKGEKYLGTDGERNRRSG